HDELEHGNGTLIDSPAWEASGGAIGGSLNFSGTPVTQIVEIPRSAWYEPTAITVSVLVKRAASQPDNAPYIISKNTNGTQKSYSIKYYKSDGTARFNVRSSSNSYAVAASATSIPADTWTHITG